MTVPPPEDPRWNAAGLVRSRAEAEDLLRSMGAEPEPMLALTGTLPSVGPVDRLFGVVARLAASGPIRSQVAPLLELPANERIAARLADGSLRHLPVNRWIALQLAFELVPFGIHLPFTFRPLNGDLAAKLEKFADRRAPDAGSRPTQFRAYFNHGVQFEGDEIVLRRVFSLPVLGSAQGTDHDPYVDTVLDDELGLVVEVFAHAG